MIVEERTYTIAPAQLGAFLRLYEQEGLKIIQPILGNLIGYFTCDIGEINTVVHLWGYESHAERERRRGELSRSDAWRAFTPKILPCIQHMQSRVLVPTSFSPLR